MSAPLPLIVTEPSVLVTELPARLTEPMSASANEEVGGGVVTGGGVTGGGVVVDDVTDMFANVTALSIVSLWAVTARPT